MPDRHALLGPSRAERWMACPPSARLCESREEESSEYAKEGTLAHRFGELLLKGGPQIELDKVRSDPLYSAEMEEYVQGYAEFVRSRVEEAKARCVYTRLCVELEVDLTDYVPEGFGTSDAVILSDDTMEVIDLKYGMGVRVSAPENPQMRLYALGAYGALGWAYDVHTIRTTIYQPRLNNISSDEFPVEELLDWAEKELTPKAKQAWEGKGEFNPGEAQCRWCAAAPQCRALAQYQLELAQAEFADPALLSPEEIGKILERLPHLTAWAETMKKHALSMALAGDSIPGFKLVEGRSARKYADPDGIAKRLTEAGFPKDRLFKPRELLGITAMEKLVGRKRLTDLAGDLIIKPEGSPALVPLSDKRPELTCSAADDFKEDYHGS